MDPNNNLSIDQLRGSQAVTLHLNPDFYQLLKTRARGNRRSLNAEVISLLVENIGDSISIPVNDKNNGHEVTGDDIKRYRNRHDLTQAQLAKKMEILHPETISRWENGGKISPVYQRLFKRLQPPPVQKVGRPATRT